MMGNKLHGQSPQPPSPTCSNSPCDLGHSLPQFPHLYEDFQACFPPYPLPSANLGPAHHTTLPASPCHVEPVQTHSPPLLFSPGISWGAASRREINRAAKNSSLSLRAPPAGESELRSVLELETRPGSTPAPTPRGMADTVHAFKGEQCLLPRVDLCQWNLGHLHKGRATPGEPLGHSRAPQRTQTCSAEPGEPPAAPAHWLRAIVETGFPTH